MPISYKFFYKTEEEITLLISFYEATITPKDKPTIDIMRKLQINIPHEYEAKYFLN